MSQEYQNKRASLMKDTLLIEKLAFSDLLLMNAQEVLWLILLPRQNVIELIDLDSSSQAALLSEINTVSQLLKKHFPCDKLNIAMLGNILPQLHVHIIARRFDDPFFPKPVFGLPFTAYDQAELHALIQKIKSLL